MAIDQKCRLWRGLGGGGADGWLAGMRGGTTAGAALMTIGVFGGSAAWWVVLTSAVGGLRARITPRWLRRINVVSGLLIGGFALVAIATAVT